MCFSKLKKELFKEIQANEQTLRDECRKKRYKQKSLKVLLSTLPALPLAEGVSPSGALEGLIPEGNSSLPAPLYGAAVHHQIIDEAQSTLQHFGHSLAHLRKTCAPWTCCRSAPLLLTPVNPVTCCLATQQPGPVQPW